MALRRKCGRLLYSFVQYLPSNCSRIKLLQGALRATVAKMILMKCGTHITIDRKAYFASDVQLGDYSGIGENCEIHGPCEIGSYVMMAPECIVYTVNHSTERIDVPMALQGETAPKKVTIGDDCWIGRRTMIMPGVTIGSHSIIAAGAVVTRNVPEYTISGGVPARVLRYRNKSEVEEIL